MQGMYCIHVLYNNYTPWQLVGTKLGYARYILYSCTVQQPYTLAASRYKGYARYVLYPCIVLYSKAMVSKGKLFFLTNPMSERRN